MRSAGVGRGRWRAFRAGAMIVFLGVAALAAAGGRPAGAQNGEPMRLVSLGARPVTDTWRAMLAREARLLAAEAAGRPQLPRLRRFPQPGAPPRPQPVPDEPQLFIQSTRRSPQTIGTNFAGIGLQTEVSEGFTGGYIPPDTNGAVGPGHFAELINGSFTVFDKAGSRFAGRVRLDTFFSTGAFPRNGSFDPHILYDRRSGHWFACALEFGSPAQQSNQLLLAVSRTSDPTGTWDKYVLSVARTPEGGDTFFTDFPTLGVDDNGVYAAVRIFSNNTPTSSFRIAATPKAPLIAGSPSIGAVFVSADLTDMFATPFPATNFDAVGASGPAWFVSPRFNFLSGMAYRTLTWSGGTPTLSALSTLDSTAIPGFDFPPEAPALGSSQNLDAGDMRMLTAVVRNNRLWTCRNVGVNNSGGGTAVDRCGVEWIELSLSGTTATKFQSGRVFDPSPTNPRFYYYGTVMVNGQGHAVLAFSVSSASEFIAVYTCGRLASDAPGTMGTVTQVKAGEGAYRLTLGGALNRWGDYSYTSLDPVDDMSVWTIQEYATTGPNQWGTWVARLLSPAPTVNNPAAAGDPGTSGSFNLSGTGFFDPGAGFSRPAVTFSGSGVTATSVVVNSQTSATVNFSVSGGAASSARNLTFTNPDGQTGTAAGGFTVGGSNPGSPPLAPSSVQAALVDAQRVDLTWSDNSDDEQGFRIDRRTGAGPFVQVATAAPNAQSASDTSGVAPNTSYTYRVAAFNTFGENSAEAAFTVPTGGKVKVSPATVKFPKTTVGTSKLKTVTIKNTHKTESLIVNVGTLGAPFSVTGATGISTIGPKSQIQVTVSFAPTSEGLVNATLAIATSDPLRGTADLPVSGTGK